MSMFVSMVDHLGSDGMVNWDSYRAAQVANGERCSKCGGDTGTIYGRGHRDLCGGCKDFESDKSEVTHRSRVRCPAMVGLARAVAEAGLTADPAYVAAVEAAKAFDGYVGEAEE